MRGDQRVELQHCEINQSYVDDMFRSLLLSATGLVQNVDHWQIKLGNALV